MSHENAISSSSMNGLYDPDKQRRDGAAPPFAPRLPAAPYGGATLAPQANGFDSSHSSRNSSPGGRLQPIPASQLPPARPPPSKGDIHQLTANYEQLRVVAPPPAGPSPNRGPAPSNPGSGGAKQAGGDVRTASDAQLPPHFSPFANDRLGSQYGNMMNESNSESGVERVAPSVAGYFNQAAATVGAHAQRQYSPVTPSGATLSANSQRTPIVSHAQHQLQQPSTIVNANGSAAPNLNSPSFHQSPPNALYRQSAPQTAPFSPQIPAQQPQQNYAHAAPPNGHHATQPIPNTGRTNLHTNRYPTMPNYQQRATQPPQLPVNQQNTFNYQQAHSAHAYQQSATGAPAYQSVAAQQQTYSKMNVTQAGFNRMWGQESVDLLQMPNVLPPTQVEVPRVSLGQDALDAANCSAKIFRATMTKIPESNALLQKSRLPLGILIHPFKDLEHLTVIQCDNIVRCRACRTYINPFVFFVDAKRWKCNLCFRVNDLPEQFQYDPITKTYGDPSRRPEIKTSTIEYIAPAEYMVRPPQPATYIFLLDVSQPAVESGYLHMVCSVLRAHLANIPGDARTQIGFIAYNSALHFYALADGLSQPHEMTVIEIDDVFLPCPDNLVVNMQEHTDLIGDLLQLLPARFAHDYDNSSALGAALQAAHKIIAHTGGRVTVFQATLPNIGPGALAPREDPNQRAANDVQNLNPANDFYKRLALECNSQQIAVDLFLVNSQFVDLATISGVCTFSGGCIHHFPLFKASRTLEAERLERALRRYLLRKIGFEAVMRIRCTRGLSIHTFHGNFFVRSSDLLLLPNVNPDAGYGMQLTIEESLSDLQSVCFQAALLYTSSKGDRRIRVHTLCVPVTNTLQDVLHAADQQCIVGLLAKMAVDRSLQSSLSDAREAFINVAIDILGSYKMSLNLGGSTSSLLVPQCLKLLPLYIAAMMKHTAFRTGTATRLDDRVKAMCDMKTLPLPQLIQLIYPDLYPVHDLEERVVVMEGGEEIAQPPRLQLSARSLEVRGAYLMDVGEHMVLLVGAAVSPAFLQEALGVADYKSIGETMYELPLLDNVRNQRLNGFVKRLNDEKPYDATLHIIGESSQQRAMFIERLIEDRVENALSYHEFLQHLKSLLK